VRFGLQLWSQQTSWAEFRDAALAAEAAGWDSVWTWDHLNAIFGPWEQPIFEGWTVLSAVGALTSRLRLGLMVGANTFRNPALTAKMATTLDHMSDGRAILGIGGAWFEREHEAYGLDFGSGFGERLDWLDEAVDLMAQMLRDGQGTARGRFYHATNVRNDPPPVQRRLPILIGGDGEKKTLHTVAKYADAWNTGGDVDFVRHKDEVLRRWCDEVGRDQAEIERTLGMGTVIIRDKESDARSYYAEIQRQHPGFSDQPKIGTAEQLADRLRPYVELGFRHIFFDASAPFDDETLERFVTEVKPRLEAVRAA
jgi:F420-dependent oxidoreductase-like protein